MRRPVPVRSRLSIAVFAALLPALAAAQATAADRPTGDGPGVEPKWEAGLAAGAGWLPDYPGAGQSHGRGLVAPVLLYHGPILRIDRGGVRGHLLDTPDFDFELTATAAFDARNNGARAGMPDLDYLVGVGPQLVYKGLRGVPGAPTLHLKLRAMLSTDFHRLDDRGATFVPELRWRLRGPPWLHGSTLGLSLESTWASGALSRYFYQVEPSQATPARPAYSARAGYLGTEATANLTRREGRSLSWFVTASAMSLHGAANAASPLLRSRGNFSIGAGLVWTPWQSQARAED